MTTLTYRGVQYNYTPPAVKTQATDVVAKYRGYNYTCVAAVNPPAQAIKSLTFRGFAYQTGTAAIPAAVVMANSAAAINSDMNSNNNDLNAMARSLTMSHHRVIKNREQALLVRTAELVGLPVGVASHYWNQVQGKINPNFRASYDRSHVALS